MLLGNYRGLLTPFEPECDMGESVKAPVAALGNVWVKDGSSESLFLISDNDESIISTISDSGK